MDGCSILIGHNYHSVTVRFRDQKDIHSFEQGEKSIKNNNITKIALVVVR